MTTTKEFFINQFLSLRLEHDQTMIYVGGKLSIQCKFLLLDIPVAEIGSLNDISSIDDASDVLDHSLEKEPYKFEIPPEVEFWGHCSNLQVWYEHEYDTRLLHSNLAFALLRKLAEVGDPIAKKKFKSELIIRYESGNDRTREFIEYSGALECFSSEEWLNIILDIDDLMVLMEWVESYRPDRNPLEMISDLILSERIVIRDKRVVKLDFSGQSLKFDEFPKVFYGLQYLEVLWLGFNNIKELPDDINELVNLKDFSLSTKRISQIPDSLCEITSLEKLGLSVNRIQALPEKIGILSNLKALHIGSNEIKKLPDSIYGITSLEELWLKGNKICNLSEKFGDLINLKMLDLGSNEIKELPKSFCNLTSLKWLSLSNNHLKELPKCLMDLQSLEYLDVSKNPLVENPEIVEKIKKLSIRKRF